MMIVGLTGGIGSGKSAATRVFQSLGVPVIDADVVAHDLVKPGQKTLERIGQEIGTRFINEEGELNRALLRHAILDDPQLKLRLESIMHPLIRSEIKRQVKALKALYCVVVVPLLAEHHKEYDWVHRILVIDAPEDLQLSRLHQRSGLDQASALKLIELQATRDQRLKLADDIIVNDGKLDDLEQEIHQLHQKYHIIAQHTQ